MWGPAWVAWVGVDDYVGWAPLAPSDYTDYSRVPGGLFTYVSANALANQNVGTQAMFARAVPAAKSAPTEIFNLGHAAGAVFNKGPAFAMLQRLGTPLPERVDDARFRRVNLQAAPAPAAAREAELLARTQHLVREANREWNVFRNEGGVPPPVPVAPRPGVTHPPLVKPPAAPLARDSTQVRRRTEPDSAAVHARPGGPRRPRTPPREPAEPADSTRAR